MAKVMWTKCGGKINVKRKTARKKRLKETDHEALGGGADREGCRSGEINPDKIWFNVPGLNVRPANFLGPETCRSRLSKKTLETEEE